MELKEKVVRGVAWSAAEKIGSMGLQAVVSLLLLRLLTPQDYGLVAIPMVLATVALVIVEGGFSQALIRKEHVSELELSSVFFTNISVSVVLYALLAALSVPLARLYGQPLLARIAPVVLLLLPLSALCVIQNTLLTRRFAFRRLSAVIFFSTLLSGALAVGMALSGMGVWSLAAQYLSQMFFKAVLLWIAGGWRPRRGFSLAPIREMFPYGSRLMATDLLTAVYNNAAKLFIGKMYSTRTLGFFNQAQKLRDMPLTSTVQAVQGVTFPALAGIGANELKLAESFRQVVTVLSFVVMPMMAGFIVVAPDAFAFLVGEKWMPTVPYFRIFCAAGFAAPTALISYNILKVKSNGGVILRLEIVKKAIMTLVLALTIPVGARAVAWGMAAMVFVEAAFNFAATRRYTLLSAVRLLRSLLPVVAATAVMAAAAWGAGHAAASLHAGARLGIEIATGIVVYPLAARLLRVEALGEVKGILLKLLGK